MFSLYVIYARNNFHMPIYEIPLINAIKESDLEPMLLITGAITPRQSGLGLKINIQLHPIPTAKKKYIEGIPLTPIRLQNPGV